MKGSEAGEGFSYPPRPRRKRRAGLGVILASWVPHLAHDGLWCAIEVWGLRLPPAAGRDYQHGRPMDAADTRARHQPTGKFGREGVWGSQRVDRRARHGPCANGHEHERVPSRAHRRPAPAFFAGNQIGTWIAHDAAPNPWQAVRMRWTTHIQRTAHSMTGAGSQHGTERRLQARGYDSLEPVNDRRWIRHRRRDARAAAQFHARWDDRRCLADQPQRGPRSVAVYGRSGVVDHQGRRGLATPGTVTWNGVPFSSTVWRSASVVATIPSAAAPPRVRLP